MEKQENSKNDKKPNSWFKTLLNYVFICFFAVQGPFSVEIQAKITTTSWQVEQKISYINL